MENEVSVELEADPVPIVRAFGTLFRNSLTSKKIADTARSMQGSFALVNTTDPQKLTVTVNRGDISLKRGRDPDVQVTIHGNFDRLSDPRYKPKVEGFFRHPLFAMKIGKLLESPVTNWSDHAKRFWDHNHKIAGMPQAIKVISNDDNRTVTLGESEPEVEIEGNDKNLSTLFSGGSVLVSEVMTGKVRVKANIKHLTVLSEVTLNYILGEL